MSFYLLNISVDTADPYPDHIPEDLSINDQESIVEIVVEKVLGYENAIGEYDDPDTKEHKEKTNIKIDLTTHYTIDANLNKSFAEARRQKFPDHNTYLTSGFQKIDTPPPKI